MVEATFDIPVVRSPSPLSSEADDDLENEVAALLDAAAAEGLLHVDAEPSGDTPQAARVATLRALNTGDAATRRSGGHTAGTAVERMHAWLARRDARLAEAREKARAERDQLDPECTFSPTLLAVSVWRLASKSHCVGAS